MSLIRPIGLLLPGVLLGLLLSNAELQTHLFESIADARELVNVQPEFDDNDGGEEQEMRYEDLPQNVREAFERHADPDTVVEVEAEIEGESAEYEIEYRDGDVEHSLVFTHEAALMEHQSEIAVDSLPQAVRDTVVRRYPNARIEEIEQVEKVVYEIELSSDRDSIEIEIDPIGELEDEETDHDGGEEEEDDDGGRGIGRRPHCDTMSTDKSSVS